MISISLNLDTGVAKVDIPTTIKAGAPSEPVSITLNRDPGSAVTFQLALGPQSSTPGVLAYLDVFASQGAKEYEGVLNLNDTRLITYMSGKQATGLDAELTWTIDGETQVSPNFSVTCQPRIIQGPETTEGGPVYVTMEQLNAAIAAAFANGLNAEIQDGDLKLSVTNGLITSITNNT